MNNKNNFKKKKIKGKTKKNNKIKAIVEIIKTNILY